MSDDNPTFRPRIAEHFVSAIPYDLTMLPVPYAVEGTTMCLTRVRAEWRRLGTDPWRLMVVTVDGVMSNGSPVTIDYFPDHAVRKPPAKLSRWIASTHPNRVKEGQNA
jgi:hypothetical protein